tara:strand:- start:55 stop:192 length:138 start_codon:yes stop_codon:yes gene_type:complete
MSLIKKIILFFVIFFTTRINQLPGQEIKKIGKFKNWESLMVSNAE